MRNNSNIFLGAILIIIGILALGITNNWFDFEISLREIAKYWPVLLILGGIAVLFNPKRTIYNSTTALLVAFAIPLAIYNYSTKAVDKFKGEFNEDFNFEWNEEDNFNYENEENASDSNNINKNTQNFDVTYSPTAKEAYLEIGGGAAEFHLEAADDQKIFQANTNLRGGRYSLIEELKGDKHEIEFNLDSKKSNKSYRLGKNSNNDVFLKLNKNPIWDLDLKIGAATLKFDLTEFKVKKLDVKTGAADINFKIGEKYEAVDVNIDGGVASVNIEVPKNSGCEINMDGALNAREFEGFAKVGNKKWQTENFDSAKNKISIKIKSGLSSVKVERF